jgi:hypothetical protein
MVTKGLFARSFRRRTPDDCAFDIGRLDPLIVAQQWESLIQHGAHVRFAIGEEVFFCIAFVASNDPLITHWLLRFYTSVFFIVTVRSTSSLPFRPLNAPVGTAPVGYTDGAGRSATRLDGTD